MNKKLLFIIFPVLLIFSMALIFYSTKIFFGKYISYVSGMLFYWIFWCLAVPVIVTKKPLRFFFIAGKPLILLRNWWVMIIFASTIVAPIFMYKTFSAFLEKPLSLILINIPFALLNGLAEETFWRGFFIKEFPNSILWGIVVPSIFFALWHFCPSIALPHDRPVFFVMMVLPLGLVNGIVAYQTKSAKWTAIAHAAGGVLQLVGPVALSISAIAGNI